MSYPFASLPELKSHENTGVKRPKYEVADVLRDYLPDYLKNHLLSDQQFKITKAILSCRTAALGGHVRECDNPDCKYEEPSYNSCGNRHCPKCQGKQKNKWLKKRLKEVLPAHYYHVVFTIPHNFNDLTLYNKRLIYDILFDASSKTLKELASNPDYLGAQMGFLGLLHTWGQTLLMHPHIHYVVPGGGIRVDDEGNEEWIELPKRDKFLFPRKVLSDLFRGKFIAGLKKAYYGRKLVLPDTLSELSDPRYFEMFIDRAVNRRWNVFAKQPFSGPAEVLLYIGRYTHRVAISNHRIKSIDKGKVSFEYKDNKDKDKDGRAKLKVMTLTAEEFIRRFLLHVLPKGYHKIHMYGFLANSLRKKNIEKVKGLICSALSIFDFSDELVDKVIKSLETFQPDQCPKCNQGIMQVKKGVPRIGWVYIEVADSS